VNRVEVRLRASPSIIQRISPGAVSAHVDLSAMKAGEHIVHLTEATIRVPFGVRVVKITPSVLTLGLEPTERRTVPVRPRLLGEPAPGYTLGTVASQPPEIQVKGPKSRVALLESVYTEPVSIDGARAPVAVDVNVGLGDPLVRLEGNPEVRVTAEVKEQQDTRVFPDLEVFVEGGQATVQPARVAATLVGPASVLRAVQPGDVRASVALSTGAPPRQAAVTITLAPGHPGIVIKGVAPAQVAVLPARHRRKS
jgi:YbbR domain-containing protein